MARQADRLVKIGPEGFAAIDEHFGRAKRRPPIMKVPYAHPTYYYVHQANQIPATKLIDSNEAAQRYNGKVFFFFFLKMCILFKRQSLAGVVQKLHNILLWQKDINRIKPSIRKTKAKKTLE